MSWCGSPRTRASSSGSRCCVRGWLERLYTHPNAWGRGVGSRLHDEAVELIRGLGSSRCSLWVLEANERARSFYETRGWRLNGDTRVVPYPPNPVDVGYSLDF